MRENLSRRVVTNTTEDSLAAIAFVKNRRRVSNTCDLLCRLYFARLDARIVLARDHLYEVDFNVSRVPGQSRARVNSKSYAIYDFFFFCGFLEMCGVCGMVVGVVMRAADTFSSIHRRSE